MLAIPVLAAALSGAAALDLFPASVASGAIPVTPFLSPDNAKDYLPELFDEATSTIDVSVQYISKFNGNLDWGDDQHFYLRALVRASERGVRVRVILEGGADDDNTRAYLAGVLSSVAGGNALYMGDDVGWNHNKGIVIDGRYVLVSSNNWSRRSIETNREAGVMIDSTAVANAFLSIFNEDWSNAGTTSPRRAERPLALAAPAPAPRRAYVPLTEFPTFSSSKTVLSFANPDSANDVIVQDLSGATESLYVQIYSMTLSRIVDTVIDAKLQNPGLDIRIIISESHSSSGFTATTRGFAEELSDAYIDVYNSSPDLGLTHSKIWIADGRRTTVYTGNWSGTSASSNPERDAEDDNRDWGVVIDDTETAAWFTENLFNRDLALGSPFVERANSVEAFSRGAVSEPTDIYFAVVGSDPATARFDDECDVPLTKARAPFMYTARIDPSGVCPGTHELAIGSARATFTVLPDGPWRVLITEVLFDGTVEPDDEFVEVTNLFGFPVDVSGYRVASVGQQPFVLPEGTELAPGEALVVARSASAFQGNFGRAAEFEWDFLSLSNSGDNIAFFDQTGVLLDAVVWGSSSVDGHVSINVDPRNMESIRRKAGAPDTDDCSEDFEVVDANPGSVPWGVDVEGCNSGSSGVCSVVGGDDDDDDDDDSVPPPGGDDDDSVPPSDDDDDDDDDGSVPGQTDDDDDDDDDDSGDDDDDDDDDTVVGLDAPIFYGVAAAGGLVMVGTAAVLGPRLYRKRKARKEQEMYSMFS